MSASIFIKSWKQDLPWLHYCLRSIRKFGSGFEGITLVVDESCTPRMMKDFNLSGVTLVRVPDWENGYVQQQAVKLSAGQMISSDLILFVDSDCIFHTPFSPESFMRDGKPVLLKTKYGNLGGAEAWKAITEAVVGWPVEYEYMRRLPWMYRRDTLFAFKNTFPELIPKLKTLKDRSFSEFNALGAFIDRYESHLYHVSDTEVWMPPSVARQFWSWSGLNTDDKKAVEELLA